MPTWRWKMASWTKPLLPKTTCSFHSPLERTAPKPKSSANCNSVELAKLLLNHLHPNQGLKSFKFGSQLCNCNVFRSIIFENPHPVTAPTSNVQTILEAVKDVAKTIDVVVGEETAKEFINLLKIVKVSSSSDLLAVYNQVRSGVGKYKTTKMKEKNLKVTFRPILKNWTNRRFFAGVGDKNAAKRLYLDALLRAGNGETVEAILQLLNSKQLDELDSKLALLSLNVVRHATEGSVKAVTVSPQPSFLILICLIEKKYF